MRAFLFCLALTSLCSAAGTPTADEIVRRSVALTESDWRAAPNYTFTEKDVVTKAKRSIHTYEVLMIDGSPYQKQIAIDGEPLSAGQVAEEDRKLAAEIAKRRSETAAQREKRISAYQRERTQDNALLQEMIKAMNFRLVRTDRLDGRTCYVLVGNPKPGYRPPTRETKVLKGMKGELWIDQQELQWVKVKAEVFRPVSFGLFIAQVQPGTEFELEQRPVAPDLWLPSHFSMRVVANVLGFWSHNYTDDESYWNYRPTSREALNRRAGSPLAYRNRPASGTRHSSDSTH